MSDNDTSNQYKCTNSISRRRLGCNRTNYKIEFMFSEKIMYNMLRYMRVLHCIVLCSTNSNLDGRLCVCIKFLCELQRYYVGKLVYVLIMQCCFVVVVVAIDVVSNHVQQNNFTIPVNYVI